MSESSAAEPVRWVKTCQHETKYCKEYFKSIKKSEQKLKLENKGQNLLLCEDIELVVLIEL